LQPAGHAGAYKKLLYFNGLVGAIGMPGGKLYALAFASRQNLPVFRD
jgi:hypothetical protein